MQKIKHKASFSAVFVLALAVFAAGVGLVSHSAQGDVATVITTDKTKYSVGEQMIITGSGFSSNGSVNISVLTPRHETETLPVVQADPNGGFVTYYTPVTPEPGRFKITATDGANSAITAATEADASIGTYDQCSNDLGTGYTSGDTGCRWINGNLQSNNSVYFEGESTVQRLWLDGLTPGTTHTVTFQYGTTKAAKHAYDFLTTWNASENLIVLPDQCQDITGCLTGADDTEAIPADPLALGHDTAFLGTRNITMRGGTINSVTVPALVSGSYAGDSETEITVSYNVAATGDMCVTKSGNTTCGIAIWFGAHISIGAGAGGWGAGTGASSISGSPYHVALSKIDGASVGQRDNQMQSATVVANSSITIIKDSVPDDAQDFSFATTGTGLSAFSLDDDADGTLSNTKTFNGLAAGTYTVDEGVVAGWTLTNLVCVDPTTNSSTVLGTGVATINLAAGETVTCTYTNTLQLGHIIVVKDAVPDDAQNFTFTNNFGNSNPASFDLDNDNDGTLSSSRDSVVVAGKYSVSEGAVSGWTQTSATCDQGETINDIDVAPGETVTCTFVNTKLTTSVITELHKAIDDVVLNNAHVALGTIMHDKATVSANTGVPTGNVVFTFYTSGDCTTGGTAGSPISVNGSGVAHPSASTSALGAGSYSFKAHYNGDGNYPASDSSCEPFIVDKAQLAITTTIHNANHQAVANGSHVALGSVMHDNADVTGGVGSFPIPAISFTLNAVGVANAGAPEGAFEATSVASAALVAGNYTYQATVATDTNYIGVTSSEEPFIVDKAQLHISTDIHDTSHNVVTSVALGSVVHDTATISGQIGSIAPTGAVTFTFDKFPSDCGITSIATAGASDSGKSASVATSSLTPGTYNFRGSIAGDVNYLGEISSCEPLTVGKGTSSVVTELHKDSGDTPVSIGGSVPLGTSMHDKATVTVVGASIFPTGSVTFNFYNNGTCSGQGVPAGNIALNGANPGIAHPSQSTGVLSAGDYSFQANWIGDSNYDGNTSSCENFTVNKAQLVITTTIHSAAHNIVPNGGNVPLGSVMHDNADVTGEVVGFAIPAITFTLNGGAVANGSTELTFDATSVDSAALAAGNYTYQATVASNVNYAGATSAEEPFVVDKAQLAITTIVHNAADQDKTNSNVPLGSVMHDTSTVTGGVVGFTVPTPTFSLTSSYTGTCAAGSAVANNGTEGSANKSADSVSLGAGAYAYRGAVAGNANYEGATGACEPFTVDKAQLSITTTVHDSNHVVIANNAHVPLGSIAHDNASVTGAVVGFPIPAISFTFNAGAIANTATEGAFSATSVATSALGAGNHVFNATVASNSNYDGATSAQEPFVVDKVQLVINTTIHNAGHTVIPNNGHVVLGTNAHDNATVTGAVAGFPIPGISFTFNAAAIANGSTDATFSATSVGTGALAAGNYAFNATVGSNSNYDGATSAQEPFIVDKAQLGITTKVHDSLDVDKTNSSVPLNSVMHDIATLTGAVGGFTPAVPAFTLTSGYTNDCSAGAAVTNNGLEGSDFKSANSVSLGAGAYAYRATVAGDDNYIGATGICEPFSVNKANTTTATDIHNASHAIVTTVALGTTVHDSVTVTSSGGTPTGNVTFDWFLNGDCSVPTVATSSAQSLSGGTVDATAFFFQINSAGMRSFRATYTGSADFNGSVGACEPLAIVDANIQITPDIATNQVGNPHVFTGHVNVNDGTGFVNAPAGTVISFTIDAGPGSFTTVNPCLTVGVTGSCTITLTSAVTGVTTVSAHTTVSVGGVSLTRNTDGTDGNSGAAHKTYVNAKISITPNATNEVGQPHTFTVTVMEDAGDGAGFVAAAGESVTVTLTNSNGAVASPVGPFAGATDALGQFQVTFTSATAGTVTGHASTTVSVGGLNIPVQTNGGINSTDAVKTFVDAKIILSPLTATNPIGSPHTIVATVSQNTGNGSFTPAPDGTTVTFSITNNAGATAVFVGSNTCNTTGGTCSVQINSPTAGNVDINAATTFSVGGVSLTRATDGTHGSSGKANKVYEAGALDITKTLDVTQYPVLGLPNVDKVFTFHIVGPSYPGGHDEFFTVVDGVLQAPTTIHLSPLIPGDYTITETGVDPVAWTVTGSGGVTAVVANETASKTINNALKKPSTTISISSNTQETVPGENVILTITDTNNGQVPLNNASVVLTYGAKVETMTKTTSTPDNVCVFTSGDTGNVVIMGVGEAWTWTCTIMITGDTTFVVDGHGTDSFGTDVTPANGVQTEHGEIVVKASSTTRTLGFWQTHTAFTTKVFNTIWTTNKFIGQDVVVGVGTHKGRLTNSNQVFAGFYAPIPKKTTGAKRDPIDQARITLLQQLLAAKLNCVAFGCGATVQGQITAADAAYAGNDKNAIMSYVSILDAYNNSGDSGAIPVLLGATGKATPKDSQVQVTAAGTFWDLP